MPKDDRVHLINWMHLCLRLSLFLMLINFVLFQLRNASGAIRQDHAILVRWFTNSTRSITNKGDGK